MTPASGEVCGNMIDDDCNAMVDDGCGECTPGESRPCYTGAAGTAGRGVCRAGTQVCGMNRVYSMTCTGEVVPSAERCDGMDNNCNGIVDDSPEAALTCMLPGATAACTSGQCTIAACTGSRANCDNNATNGCEVDTNSSDAHCAGTAHTCALRRDGTAVCWGAGAQGALGRSSTANSATPVVVVGLTDGAQLSAGNQATCARRSNGAVTCWGYNAQGQLGDGSTANRPVADLPVFGLP